MRTGLEILAGCPPRVELTFVWLPIELIGSQGGMLHFKPLAFLNFAPPPGAQNPSLDGTFGGSETGCGRTPV